MLYAPKEKPRALCPRPISHLLFVQVDPLPPPAVELHAVFDPLAVEPVVVCTKREIVTKGSNGAGFGRWIEREPQFLDTSCSAVLRATRADCRLSVRLYYRLNDRMLNSTQSSVCGQSGGHRCCDRGHHSIHRHRLSLAARCVPSPCEVTLSCQPRRRRTSEPHARAHETFFEGQRLDWRRLSQGGVPPIAVVCTLLPHL